MDDPSKVAALLAAPEARPLLASTEGVSAYSRLGTLPFDHERQLSSVVVRGPHGGMLITKGAPEALMARCSNVPEGSLAVLERLFEDGERVVAVAPRAAGALVAPLPADEHDLRLTGFLTFVDRPKADAGAAIERNTAVTGEDEVPKSARGRWPATLTARGANRGCRDDQEQRDTASKSTAP